MMIFIIFLEQLMTLEIYYYFPTILLEIFSLFFENSSPREFSLQNQTLTFLKFQSPASEIKIHIFMMLR